MPQEISFYTNVIGQLHFPEVCWARAKIAALANQMAPQGLLAGGCLRKGRQKVFQPTTTNQIKRSFCVYGQLIPSKKRAPTSTWVPHPPKHTFYIHLTSMYLECQSRMWAKNKNIPWHRSHVKDDECCSAH